MSNFLEIKQLGDPNAQALLDIDEHYIPMQRPTGNEPTVKVTIGLVKGEAKDELLEAIKNNLIVSMSYDAVNRIVSASTVGGQIYNAQAIPLATGTTAGLVFGSADIDKVNINADGTMTVNGYQSLRSDVNNLQNHAGVVDGIVAQNTADIASTSAAVVVEQGRNNVQDGRLTSVENRMTSAEGNIYTTSGTLNTTIGRVGAVEDYLSNNDMVTDLSFDATQNVVRMHTLSINRDNSVHEVDIDELPSVTSSNAGTMPVTLFNQLGDNTQDISNLKLTVAGVSRTAVYSGFAIGHTPSQAELTNAFNTTLPTPVAPGDRLTDVTNGFEYIYDNANIWHSFVQFGHALVTDDLDGIVTNGTTSGSVSYNSGSPGIGQVVGWSTLKAEADETSAQVALFQSALTSTNTNVAATSTQVVQNTNDIVNLYTSAAATSSALSTKQNAFTLGTNLYWNPANVLNATATPPNNSQINLTLNTSSYASFTLDQASSATFDFTLNSDTVGLGNVANLAPNDLPVSSATSSAIASAIANSVPNILAGTNVTVSYSGVNAVISAVDTIPNNPLIQFINSTVPVTYAGFTLDQSTSSVIDLALNSDSVGLGNVANLAPLDLPINNATSAKLNINVGTDTQVDADLSSTVKLNKTYTNLMTGTSTAQVINLPVATVSYAGVVDPAMMQTYTSALADIASIKDRLSSTARTAVGNLGNEPAVADITAAFNSAFPGTPANPGDKFINIDENLTYIFGNTGVNDWEAIVTGTIKLATTTNNGIVSSSPLDGAISYNTPGIGQVNGWDTLNTKVTNTSTLASNNANNLTALNAVTMTSTTNTDTTMTTLDVSSRTIQSMFQTVWAKIRSVVNGKQNNVPAGTAGTLLTQSGTLGTFGTLPIGRVLHSDDTNFPTSATLLPNVIRRFTGSDPNTVLPTGATAYGTYWNIAANAGSGSYNCHFYLDNNANALYAQGSNDFNGPYSTGWTRYAKVPEIPSLAPSAPNLWSATTQLANIALNRQNTAGPYNIPITIPSTFDGWISFTMYTQSGAVVSATANNGWVDFTLFTVNDNENNRIWQSGFTATGTAVAIAGFFVLAYPLRVKANGTARTIYLSLQNSGSWSISGYELHVYQRGLI